MNESQFSFPIWPHQRRAVVGLLWCPGPKSHLSCKNVWGPLLVFYTKISSYAQAYVVAISIYFIYLAENFSW